MEDLYGNLDNYNEGVVIEELREENKDLKCKLEEYTTAVDKLQKNIFQELDTLQVEHNKLQTNFDSLLKTARSEIARKTQAITKLNIEKDAMVLNSINRNLPYKQRWNKKTNNQDTKLAKPTENKNENQVPSITNVPNERTIEHFSTESLKTSLNVNPSQPPHISKFQTRLLNMVNKSDMDPNINKIRQEAKENIQNDDASKSSAKISNRRKSMPAFRMDSPRFSPVEDEVASTESCKESPREPETQITTCPTKLNTERRMTDLVESKRNLRNTLSKYDSYKHRSQDKYKGNHSQDRRNMDSERKHSSDRRRVSPERKIIFADKSIRRRYSPDRKRVSPERRQASPEKTSLRVFPDRRRFSPERRKPSPSSRRFSPKRRRVSPNKRRGSPERHKIGSRDHSTDLYQRQEYEKHRRLVSPPRDKDLCKETQKPQEICRPSDHDKYRTHSQDRYSMKHKTTNDYEEPIVKRKRFDSHHKSDIAEPDYTYLHDMSCQSPEFSHETQTSHQIKEIRLNATTELDDPRKFSSRYSLNSMSGNPVFTSIKNTDVDLKVIDSSNWDLLTMKMPDALLHKPNSSILSTDLLQKPMPSISPNPKFTTNVCQETADKPLGPETRPKPQSDLPSTQANNLVKCSSSVHHNILEYAPVETQKPLSTDMPDISSEKPISSNNQESDIPTHKPTIPVDIVNEIYMDIDNPELNMSLEPGEINDDLEIEREPVDNTTKVVQSQIRRDHINYNENCKDQILSDKQSSPKLKRKMPGKKHIKKSNATKIQDKSPSIKAAQEIMGDFDLSDETSDNTDSQIMLKQENKLPPEEQKTLVPETFAIEKVKITSESKNSKSKKKSHKSKDIEITLENNDKNIKNKEISEILHTNKNASLSIDELEKMRENLAEELKNTNTTDPIKVSKSKSVKKREPKAKAPLEIHESLEPLDKIATPNESNAKDPKIKVLTKNKDILEPLIDKSNKNKDCKTRDKKELKDSTESKDISITEPHIDVSVKNKEPKAKDPKLKSPTENKEISDVIDKSVKNKFNDTKPKLKENKKNPPELKNIPKTRKKKQSDVKCAELASGLPNIKDKGKATKFNELFGDSSSLVSPEDLGLVPAVIPADNYGAIFEDAQDATDITSMKTPLSTLTTDKRPTSGDKDKQSLFEINVNPTSSVLPEDPILAHKKLLQSDNPTQNLYENLKPESEDKENDVVKTVIISSGIQPQIVSEVVEPNSDPFHGSEDLHVLQCVKPSIIQGLELQALATSTPHKLWMQNEVPPEIDTIPIHKASNGDSSLGKQVMDNSNNTQLKETDEPDIKIIVKRRRKVVKKK